MCSSCIAPLTISRTGTGPGPLAGTTLTPSTCAAETSCGACVPIPAATAGSAVRTKKRRRESLRVFIKRSRAWDHRVPKPANRSPSVRRPCPPRHRQPATLRTAAKRGPRWIQRSFRALNPLWFVVDGAGDDDARRADDDAAALRVEADARAEGARDRRSGDHGAAADGEGRVGEADVVAVEARVGGAGVHRQ